MQRGAGASVRFQGPPGEPRVTSPPVVTDGAEAATKTTPSSGDFVTQLDLSKFYQAMRRMEARVNAKEGRAEEVTEELEDPWKSL